MLAKMAAAAARVGQPPQTIPMMQCYFGTKPGAKMSLALTVLLSA